ncbi:hypothetical protein T440DRAFT_477207 [Plenodomus tracheiphilus IPT5]|uniref:Uncharacterized protein n=1 Tax=Plenodomus tracheiphilus IPT5 TaxID=1408161 RepID=A0A6A7BEB1_9PLEO|nr:hypothetical protein T440DRAFT_477207 [Plenodomus tracheiphilus IPT5]
MLGLCATCAAEFDSRQSEERMEACRRQSCSGKAKGSWAGAMRRTGDERRLLSCTRRQGPGRASFLVDAALPQGPGEARGRRGKRGGQGKTEDGARCSSARALTIDEGAAERALELARFVACECATVRSGESAAQQAAASATHTHGGGSTAARRARVQERVQEGEGEKRRGEERRGRGEGKGRDGNRPAASSGQRAASSTAQASSSRLCLSLATRTRCEPRPAQVAGAAQPDRNARVRAAHDSAGCIGAAPWAAKANERLQGGRGRGRGGVCAAVCATVCASHVAMGHGPWHVEGRRLASA